MVRTHTTDPVHSIASLGWIVPLAIVAVVAMNGTGAPGDLAPVAAQATPYPDADRDGLRDEYEAVIRTSTETTDSDRDGFSDADEFALKTNPSSPQSTPPAELPRMSLNMLARGTTGQVHVLVSVFYEYPSDIATTELTLGVLTNRRYLKLPSSYVVANSEFKLISSMNGARIGFYEIAFPDSLVLDTEHVTFLAMLCPQGVDDPILVHKLELREGPDDVIVVDYPVDMLPDLTGPSTGGHSGTVYLPIPTTNGGGGAPPVPPTWTSARLCLRSSETVGTTGALITQEVVDASCIDGFEGFCPPTCEASVGETFTTIDPLTLAGAQ